jgi:hypothetical protein
MTRTLRRLVVVLSGTLGLTAVTISTAAPAFALSGFNHTEPLTRLPRTER